MRPDGTKWPLEKTLEMSMQAGFKNFDISFWDWALPESPFLTDDWRKWIEGVSDAASKLGVEFTQGHAYTYNFLDQYIGEEERQKHEMYTRRSIECCAILGIKTCVTHPGTDWHSVDRVSSSKTKNIKYFLKLLEYAGRFGMDLAIENMCNFNVQPHVKYCSLAEELIDLVRTINDERVGVCWDFEHADIMRIDQRKALLVIGKLLKATHVSDTHSDTDPELMHIMPMFGKIDWAEMIRTLKEIDYTGCFSYEAHNYANTLPDQVLPTALKLSFEIGDYLINIGR